MMELGFVVAFIGISSYIELCNSVPRPSCIGMRDWWHEDRGMHIFVKYIAMPLSCSLLQQNRESATFQSLARILRKVQTEAKSGIPVDFCAKTVRHTSFIRSEAAPGLQANFKAFLV